MTSPWKTFCVHFDVRDHYTVELKARSVEAACRRAQELYQRHGEEPFRFELMEGGAENWEAEEVSL